MLPKEGVKSLPDYKVLAFLRVLADYFKKMESEENFLIARDCNHKFKAIAKIEMKR